MKLPSINRNTIGEDLSAGVVLGIQSIPDGMAAGLLALVNPIYGLYSYMTGVFFGAFFTSSAFMSIQATSAMALIVASVPQVTQVTHSPDPNSALFALALLTGVIMLAAGLFKLGTLVRFVPNSVMTGFVNAIAVLIILGQLDDLTGYSTTGPNRVVRTIDLLLNLDQVHLPTLIVGLLTIILILTLEKTSLKAMGLVVAIIFASLVVPLFGAHEVAQVRDIATIPGSLPRPMLPPLSVLPGLIIPAFALAFVGLVQGATITQSVPNPDGKYPDASRDFIGQGAANLFAGLLQGMPVGGSMSATALVRSAGARSRLANMIAGVTMALAILLFGRLVGMLAMPALAGLLIVVGFRTLKLDQVKMVWRTGLVQRVVMGITFVAALFVPLQFAVLIGVGMAVLLFVFQQSNKITVVAWQIEPGRYPVESAPPAAVPAQRVTVLVPYGSLFYAAAPVFAEQLPEVTAESRHAVVIIVLRGRSEIGSTFVTVLQRYAETLRAHGSKLMLVGVDDAVLNQLASTRLLYTIGEANVFPATSQLGEALNSAVAAADAWLGQPPANAEIDAGQVPPEVSCAL